MAACCCLLLLALLSIVLAIVHRCGRLKKVRHIYLVGAVTIVTLVLTISAAGSIKYSIAHFPLTQPGTTWSTEDGSLTLAVYESKSGLSDWYEYDMRMLVDGELSIDDASRSRGSKSLASGTWRMSGSDTLVLRDGDGRIVLEREDN